MFEFCFGSKKFEINTRQAKHCYFAYIEFVGSVCNVVLPL